MGILVILFAATLFFSIDSTRRVQKKINGWDVVLMVCVGCTLFVGLLSQVMIVGKSLQ